MHQELPSSSLPTEPVITPEGRFFRVSLIRRGQVESYLCETETEAKRWASLVVQPPTETLRGPHRPAAPRPPSATERLLALVRSSTRTLKPKF